MSTETEQTAWQPKPGPKTQFKILGIVSLTHFLNDTTQSLIVAIYPLLRQNFSLSFLEIGLITLAYQSTASLLQPLIGHYTDQKPQPYFLPAGMTFTLMGLLLISFAPAYPWLLLGAVIVGTGSAVLHPEASRVARMAAGGQFGLAQSIFQVGGNAGSATGPLLAAAVVVPLGQSSLAWFTVLPLLAVYFLLGISRWAKAQQATVKKSTGAAGITVPRHVVRNTILLLVALIFANNFYISSISNYFTFYLIKKFGLSIESAQVYLFIFLAAIAVGTVLGGPVGDKIGRRNVIRISILGVAPFTLCMPYAGLVWTGILSFSTGIILASAFTSIVVFAQELVPGKVGMIAGLFFGLSFGMGGIGAAVMGPLADKFGIEFVYSLCSFLPLLGALAFLLPDLRKYGGKG